MSLIRMASFLQGSQAFGIALSQMGLEDGWHHNIELGSKKFGNFTGITSQSLLQAIIDVWFYLKLH